MIQLVTRGPGESAVRGTHVWQTPDGGGIYLLTGYVDRCINSGRQLCYLLIE